MDNTTGIVPTMPINGGADSFMWIFGLLILMGLFNGNGFGGGYNNSNAIQADVNRGFDNQNLQAQTRDIMGAVTSGTAQAVAATNQVYHDIVNNLGDKYSELARDIAGVQVAQANALANQNQCCCETKQLIQQANYDGAMRDAATNANFTAQIQSVKDMIAANKIEALQAQVNQLQLQQAMCGVIRYPTLQTWNAGPYPPATTTAAAGT